MEYLLRWKILITVTKIILHLYLLDSIVPEMRDTIKSVHFESPDRHNDMGGTLKKKPAKDKVKRDPVNLGEKLVKTLYVSIEEQGENELREGRYIYIYLEL